MIVSDDPNEVEQLRRLMNDRVWREAPVEKARSVVRQSQMAQVMEKMGSIAVEGLGQKIGSIDSRTFFRWHQQWAGCWQDDGFIREFLKDNPQCRAPGYKPKASPLRHGINMAGYGRGAA